MNYQTGILNPIPHHARYMMFTFEPESDDLSTVLEPLLELVDGDSTVVGLGPSLLAALGKDIPGLRSFPSISGPGFDIPATQYSLWLWLRGNDRGELHLRSRQFEHALAMDFKLVEVLDGFMHGSGLDLTGYEDGTENPLSDAAVAAAIIQGLGAGLDGSSFVAVQQWQHNFDRFEELTDDQQDTCIGRRKSDNQELEEAPESSHVKRTAQESFSPEAFMVRRSMPWSEGNEAGLNFVAFIKSLDSFEAMLERMVGYEDGITDALFNFSRPTSGGYYWCPPMKNNKLDLTLNEI